ncbi:MAG: ribonuclease H-like domain-containing protein [Eubacterium sp.]|nr:ribonuclease H-like domain-containing protein [Eubacterium sp.]
MQVFTETLSLEPTIITQIGRLLPCAPEKACFFDIETTGLSPQVSNVYLIGAAFIKGNTAELIQWFADDYTSEAQLLDAFSDALTDCDTVIHYNGTTFDIPYLTKKYIHHGRPDPFLKAESLDLYREVSRFCKQHSPANGKKGDNIFHTENLKLVTVERLLGFDRGQDYSGKECIRLYTDYMQEKYAHHEDKAAGLQASLLSHNRDDLVGTCLTARLLAYTSYHSHCPELQLTDEEAVFTDILPEDLSYPFTLTYPCGEALVTCEQDRLTLRIPLFTGTLYHYFPDHKNYFYLPDEDMAVHKSVGSYVDKDHREQATAANCYVKKEGTFLPLPCAPTSPDIPIFHKKNAPKGAYFIEAYSASVEMISFLL